MRTGALSTVVFADLTGSTRVFEALGNEKATRAITRLTHWIATVCGAHGGRVVKMLGDGVLAVFPEGASAVGAAVELQRVHAARIQHWPAKLRMRLQLGLACGEIIEVDGDCYGDAVNVASRLSDLSGAEQIWATQAVVDQIVMPLAGARVLGLGRIAVRGRSEPCSVFRIEWQEELSSEMLTAPAALHALAQPAMRSSGIELHWLDRRQRYDASRLPVRLGRAADAEFVVDDRRVSRWHASISWRNNKFVLSDLSSFGTWVRFAGAPTELALRREECVLHDGGEIALGSPFGNISVPTVTFSLAAG